MDGGAARYVLLVFFQLWCAPAAYAQGLAGFLSPGPLAEPHAEFDSITQCTRCHQAGRAISAAKCLECHDEVQKQVTSRRGFHADKGDTCLPCHLDHRGRAYQMVRFDEQTFDHDTTGFALGRGHVSLDCAECHEGEGYTGLDPTCTSCHDDPHGSAQSTRVLREACTHCHTDASWSALPLTLKVFDHNLAQHAAYPLEGAHQQAKCEGCHPDARFLPTAHDACTTCHDDPHRAPLSNACQSCHTIRAGWKIGKFDHTPTGFRLVGVHTTVPCKSCHTRGVIRPLKHATCADCHKDPHRGQFAPRTCDECHSVNRPGWAVEDFDHAAVGWPLEGKHAEAACGACHGDGPEASYTAVSTACASCHDDPHADRFGATCDDCHTPQDWLVTAFEHDRTDFPLTGEHREVSCVRCHGEDRLRPLDHGSCADCHRDNPHEDDVFAPEACAECHTTATWERVTYDHTIRADFALAPQHTELSCRSCHAEHRFTGLEPTCEACHAEDEPRSHFDGSCGECHRAASWLPADLGANGHDETGFPLAGAHLRVSCASCHTPGLPTGAVATDCAGCHASDDVHRNLLGNSCGDCHTPTLWMQSRWRHQLTGWPLHGAHRLAACDDCHAAGYIGTPSDCRTCHLGEAPASVPAHQTADFPFCDNCHQPYTWAAARYPH